MQLKKSILIIGAGREQIPAYQIAKKMGSIVIGTDRNPTAPAFSYADKKLICSTRDANYTLETVLEYSKNNKIDGTFVGADRIASNGDTANKIGAYSLAVLAKHHNVPFYVAAPLSTVDFDIESGLEIPVEKRSPKEVTRINNVQFTIEDIDVTTPAFDVTPAALISGIITEKGVAKFPYTHSLEEHRIGK